VIADRLNSDRWIGLSLFLLGCAVFAPSLSYDFTYDDQKHILDNPHVNAGRWHRLVLEPTWPGDLYRPTSSLTLALAHAALGRAPWHHHAASVLLHGGVCVLLFAVLLLLLGRMRATLATLLFALHPLHVEAVANISYRTELLAALFGLLSLLLALRPLDGAAPRRPSAAGLLGLFVAFLLALGAKESSLSFVLLLPLCFFVRHGLSRGWRPLLAPLGVMGAAVAVYLALRAHALGALIGPVNPGFFVDNPLIGLTAGLRILNALSLLGLYLVKLVFPWPLSADYSYAKLRPFEGLGDVTPQAALLIALVLAALGLTIHAAWRRDRRCFAGLWFFVAFAVSSNIFRPIGTIFAERLAYLPSVGLCCLAAELFARARYRTLRLVLVGGLSAVMLLLCLVGSRPWVDNTTLFRKEIGISSTSVKVRINYAVLLARQGKLDEAVLHLQRALEIHPGATDAAYNMGTMLWQQGKHDAARRLFDRALATDPAHAPTLNFLGRIAFNRADLEGAGKYFNRVLRRNNRDYDALLGMFVLHIARGELRQASAVRSVLRSIDPWNAELRRIDTVFDARARQR
jgi:tetratricopeptide (TPR) repeat protein